LLFPNPESTKESLFDLGLKEESEKEQIYLWVSLYTYRTNLGARNICTSTVELWPIARPRNEAQERVFINDIVTNAAGGFLFSKKELMNG
jgi:hypothetical protein